MRVIAGSAGGLSLTVPESVTRPTTDRVREALFSSLGDRVIDAEVLDLYAGSGALGIEALSRGAHTALFVETDERAAAALRRNLERTHLEAEVRNTTVASFLRGPSLGSASGFDLIFADPPYARDDATRSELEALLASETLLQSLRPGGLFVLEGMDKFPLPHPDPALWESLRERRYGGTRLHYLVPARTGEAA